ncbi:MAG TPA: endonuclease, partial [Phycisphaerae bacterium]|nr:endonuclease [Phycisphaerae bacterium]
MTDPNRYTQIIEHIFMERYRQGAEKVSFEREALVKAAKELHIPLPKNLGDILYSFRYRTKLPDSITSRAPKGKTWIIRAAGKARYCFVAASVSDIVP